MKKIIIATLITGVLMIGELFPQNPTTHSHPQNTVEGRAITFSTALPSEDSLDVPKEVIRESWIWMVMDCEPGEKADTNSYSVFQYTHNEHDGQFLLMHSHQTQRDYYFYFSPPGTIFRLEPQVRKSSLYDKQALNDSIAKYMHHFDN